MDYPCRIGRAEFPDVYDFFTPEIREYLVAVGGRNDYYFDRQGYTFYCRPTLGRVDIASGEESNEKSEIQFFLSDEEEKTRCYKDYFKEGVIYRIKARARPSLSVLFVEEVLEENVHNDFLLSLIAEFEKPVTLNSKKLGEFRENKKYSWFEGCCDWLGENVKLYISADKNTAPVIIKMLEGFYRSRKSWDKKLKECAARELLQPACDWLEEKISEEQFMARLTPESIELDGDCEFTVYFNDGGMFNGHSVVVYGSMQDGAESAELQG